MDDLKSGLKMIRGFVLLFLVIFIGGCSYKSVEIKDTRVIPQDLSFFVQDVSSEVLFEHDFANSAAKNIELFFSPWSEDFGIESSEKLWGIPYVKNREFYGENRLKIEKKQKEKIVDSIGLEDFPNSNLYAITTKNISLRVLPTELPTFYSFYREGEGFPFDYMQNSTLHIYTPLKIRHITPNGEWYYVDSYYVSGFVKSEDVAILSEELASFYKKLSFFTPTKDRVTLQSGNALFVENLKIGALLAKDGDNVIGFFRGSDGYGEILKLEASSLEAFPLEFEKENIVGILGELLGEKYGWGGMFGNRDCSAFTRDYFFPFGVALPRNSKAQSRHKGNFVSLEGLNRDKKRESIQNNAIPFRTLIHLNGHIMLYIGDYKDEPIVMHNLWGIRTRYFGKEYRNILGRAVITTLSPGIELPYIDGESGDLSKRITGFNIIKE